MRTGARAAWPWRRSPSPNQRNEARSSSPAWPKPRFCYMMPTLSAPVQSLPFEDLSQPLTRFEGFIFDCDGTLADTMPLHHRSWVHALGLSGARFDFDWELFQSRA